MSEQPHPIIRQLAVKNFRSLADVDVALHPLTVLVGPNGSGKSNLVDVLRFMRDAVTRGLDSAILDRGGLGSLRRWVRKGKPPDIRIDLTLAGLTWQGSYGFALASDSAHGHRVKWERLRFVEGDNAEVLLEFKEGKLGHAKGIADDRLRASLEQMSEASPRHLVAFDASRYFRVEGGTIDDFVNGMSFYAIFPDALRAPQRLYYSYPLEERGINLASVLRDIQREDRGGAREALCAALQRVVPDVERFTVTETGSYLVTKLQHRVHESADTTGPAFDLAHESDGTLRMLGILTALYQEPPRSLLAIEELEWGVHPGALSLLVDVLREASLRSQMIVTTHSPDLIADVPADALVVVEKENGVTLAGPLYEQQRQAINDRLFDAGELVRLEGLRRGGSVVSADR